MRRGRPLAKADAAAIAARADIENFMRKHGLTPAQLAPLARIGVATAKRVLARNPPAWTKGFKDIVDFINRHKNDTAGLLELTASFRGQKDAAHAAAALLRAVATLLEKV